MSIQASLVYTLSLVVYIYKIPFCPHPHQYLWLFIFFMTVILTWVKWGLQCTFNFISLITNDVLKLLICLSAARVSSFENYLPISQVYRFISQACSLTGLVGVWWVLCIVYISILRQRSSKQRLSPVLQAITSLHCSLAVQKDFSFMKSLFSVCFFYFSSSFQRIPCTYF